MPLVELFWAQQGYSKEYLFLFVCTEQKDDP